VRTVSASASFNDAGRSILVDCWRILNARRDLKDPFSKTCALTKTRLISVHGLRKILNQEKSSVPRSPLCKTLFEAFPLLDGPAKMIWSCGQFDQSEGSLYVCRLRRCITASVENVSCSCGHSTLDLRRPLRTLSLSIRYILKIIHTRKTVVYYQLHAPLHFVQSEPTCTPQTGPTSGIYAGMATRRTHNKTRLGCHQCKRRRIKV
jgi:hypothetical protein